MTRGSSDGRRYEPKTRAEGPTRTLHVERDPDTGKPIVAARSRTGRLVEKNRSDGWRGYKSHLTARQRYLMRWALRQRDRGISRERVWIALQPHWIPSPMQYSLTLNTIGMWEMTRRAMEKRGKQWP